MSLIQYLAVAILLFENSRFILFNERYLFFYFESYV